MSDVAFTPKERGLLADRVAWTPGARTESISLIDDASYSLAGDRQSGSGLIKSKANQPFVGRYRVELSDSGLGVGDRAYAEFDVQMPRSVAATAWGIVSNVLTITVPLQHEVQLDQWIVLGGFATLAAGAKGVALQVTAVTGTTFTVAFTSADASATEAGTVNYQPMAQSAAEWTTIFDNEVADETSIEIGTSRAGIYRVFTNSPNDQKSASFWSDGTEMVIETMDIAAAGAPVDVDGFDDADGTAASTNLSITAGVVSIANRNAVVGRITVEFTPKMFTMVDDDGFACFFEKDGELILRNRLGATQEFAIENIGTSRANRVASPDPNQRIVDLQGPLN